MNKIFVAGVGLATLGASLLSGCDGDKGKYLAWPVNSVVSGEFTAAHQAIDIGSDSDYMRPVFAAADGKISYMGGNPNDNSSGFFVVVNHEGNRQTLYAHLYSFKEGMSVGQNVTECEQIGYVGSTGYSTGNHVHFEVYENGQTINPRSALLGKQCPTDFKPPEFYVVDGRKYKHAKGTIPPRFYNDRIPFSTGLAKYQDAINMMFDADLRGAEEMLRAVIRENPHDPEHHRYSMISIDAGYMLGNVMLMEGRTEDAREVVREAYESSLGYGVLSFPAMYADYGQILHRLLDDDDSNDPTAEEIMKALKNSQ